MARRFMYSTAVPVGIRLRHQILAEIERRERQDGRVSPYAIGHLLGALSRAEESPAGLQAGIRSEFTPSRLQDRLLAEVAR